MDSKKRWPLHRRQGTVAGEAATVAPASDNINVDESGRAAALRQWRIATDKHFTTLTKPC